MFKLIAAVSVLIACIQAFPQQPSADASATLVSSTFADDGAGNVNYAFETSNGIRQQASGQLKDVTITDSDGAQQQGKAEIQKGTFSYQAPDGTPITVEWIADEVKTGSDF